MDEMKNQVFEIVKNLCQRQDKFTMDSLILDGGFLDSLDVLNLVEALEEAFDIRFDMEDLTIQNFNSVQLICDCIAKYKAA